MRNVPKKRESLQKFALINLQESIGELKLKDFRSTLREIMGDEKDWPTRISKVLPDAHRVNLEEKILAVYEVEDTHFLTEDKILDYAELMDILWSEYGWDMNLITVDRYGRVQGKVNLDPSAYGSRFGVAS